MYSPHSTDQWEGESDVFPPLGKGDLFLRKTEACGFFFSCPLSFFKTDLPILLVNRSFTPPCTTGSSQVPQQDLSYKTLQSSRQQSADCLKSYTRKNWQPSLVDSLHPPGASLGDRARCVLPTASCDGVLVVSHPVVSDSLQPQGPQQAGLPCPSASPGVCPNSCDWCDAHDP